MSLLLGATTNQTVHFVTKVDMALGRARQVSAQATARAAGILWPQQVRARHQMTAFRVILGGLVQKEPQLQSARVIVRLGDTRMPLHLQDQPQATVLPVTQVDLVLEAALLASVLATVPLGEPGDVPLWIPYHTGFPVALRASRMAT